VAADTLAAGRFTKRVPAMATAHEKLSSGGWIDFDETDFSIAVFFDNFSLQVFDRLGRHHVVISGRYDDFDKCQLFFVFVATHIRWAV
jgi:hypothetical protein